MVEPSSPAIRTTIHKIIHIDMDAFYRAGIPSKRYERAFRLRNWLGQ